MRRPRPDPGGPIPPAPFGVRPDGRASRLFYLVFGALALLLASAPYLIGWLSTPPGHQFTGFTYNADDGAVYLSWMRQAAEGHFFIHNRFAVEPQKDLLFNLFFWLLGTIARFTGLSLMAVYQTARVVCGGLLLWAVARLLHETLATPRARMIAFALVCVSSGLGWLIRPDIPEKGPIDLWQPEAITFLSLYYTPLFVAALALMVVFLLAALRWERGGGFRALWPALAASALLGNFHSYDILHLFAVWAVFRAASDFRQPVNWRGWTGLLLAGAAALPTAAYQAWVLRVDPVFYQRAFVSNTLSPDIGMVLLGYGLLIPLGLAGALLPKMEERFAGGEALRLLVTWAVVGIAIAYVPVSFQRKLLMGAHLPWAILAGAGIAALSARLSGDFPKIATVTLVALTVPSNAWFLMRDIGRVQANVGSTPHRPYLTDDEAAALGWLRDRSGHSDAVLVGPDPTAHLRFPGPNFALWPHLSVYVPAYAGCVVYDGHWSETPDFGRKLSETIRFFRADTDDAFRRRLLAANGIRYVLYVNALGSGPLKNPDGTIFYDPVRWPAANVPSYLHPVYQNATMSIYAVALPETHSEGDAARVDIEQSAPL